MASEYMRYLKAGMLEIDIETCHKYEREIEDMMGIDTQFYGSITKEGVWLRPRTRYHSLVFWKHWLVLANKMHEYKLVALCIRRVKEISCL